MPSGAKSCGSASSVGGDTNQRRFCKKQSTFRISELLCCVNNGVVCFKFTKINNFSGLIFLKIQPNPISVRLDLTHGSMANGSHEVRMDWLFSISTIKIV